jgi:predicted alpha/beta-hydrolase family hydrolase
VSAERLAIEGGSVATAWHPAEGHTLIALTHGAGGTMATPSLAAAAVALATRGIDVVRFNLPWSERGRRSPGAPAPDIACWHAVAAALRPSARRLLLGGRSYGGRMATHAAATGAPCDGLVLLAYPLHPPGKPERLRDAHLPDVPVPMLFLQGTRDPFADPVLLDRTLARLPRATLHRVEGGDHAHAVRGRRVDDVAAELADAIVGWLRRAVPL